MITYLPPAPAMMKKYLHYMLPVVFACLVAGPVYAQNALQIDSTGNVRIGLTAANSLTVTAKTNFTGNVTIGTAVPPAQSLAVSGNAVFGYTDNTAVAIDAGADARLGFIKKYGTFPQISSAVNTPIVFSQTNQASILSNIGTATLTERMRINANGNVGIGKADPSVKLEVAGRVKDEAGFITPQGGIMMYGGAMSNFDGTGKGRSDSPVAGWAICNGQNGTPDLRNRFIVGAGQGSNYSVGNTGGEDFHTLTTAEMPKHTHRYGYECYDVVASGKSGCWLRRNGINNGDETSSAGESKPHENRPPYYAMLYIMKL